MLNVNFTFSFNGSIPDPYAVLRDSIQVYPVITGTSVLSGSLDSAKYQFVEDVAFSYALPAVRWPNEPFDIQINYTNYNQTIDWSDLCSLTINDEPYAFTGIILAIGTYDYNITCPMAEASGQMIVDNFYIEPIDQRRFVLTCSPKVDPSVMRVSMAQDGRAGGSDEEETAQSRTDRRQVA